MNDYNLISPGPSTTDTSILAGVGIALAVIICLIVIAVVVLIIIANCKIFKKAGEEWWKALIPLYSSWIETKITGLAWWWFLIFAGLTALIGIESLDSNYVIYTGLLLVSFNYNFNLAKKFGKTNGFAVLTTILPVIGLPILAFGSAKYDKAAKVDKNGIFTM